jgi:hypothetical protein
VAKYKASAEGTSLNEFVEKVNALDIGDRQLKAEPLRLTRTSTVIYIDFYNLPKSNKDSTTRANNRVSFMVSGFNPGGPDLPALDKVKLEARVFSLSKKYKPRAKSGTPQEILKYLEKSLKTIIDEVEPKL